MNTFQNEKAGSQSHEEPAFVLVGKLQRTHGLGGEISMRVITDFPERLRIGKKLYLGEDHVEVVIEQLRWKNSLMLLKFAGFNTPEEVKQYTNWLVFKPTLNLPKLDEGKYYHHQILGLVAWSGTEKLGELVEILETGANDVYVIKQDDGRELLIPAIPQVVRNIDLENQRIEITLLEGLR